MLIESAKPESGIGRSAPDVANHTPGRAVGALSWVGMREVASPIRYPLKGELGFLPAVVDVGVSLINPDARGIHMSRLFQLAQRTLAENALSLEVIVALAKKLVDSQEGLSDSSDLSVRWQLPLERQALISRELGWRQYPVAFRVQSSPLGVRTWITVEVQYSSTCPCSTALAEQLQQEAFHKAFPSEAVLRSDQVVEWMKKIGFVATPHAQRSRATVQVEVCPTARITPEGLIEQVESALGTAVQATVKRLDEQEFARLNAQNQMFCEDAARLLKNSLDAQAEVIGYELTVEHFESLHAHNAVAVARK